MRHQVFGRQLSRSKNERKRLLEGLVRDVILHGTITTTIAKAKAVQPMVEKLVTSARENSGASVNSIRKVIRDRDVYVKFMADTKNFGDRKSGFTRIIKMGPRKGDAAEVVRFGFVEMTAVPPAEEKKPVKSQAAKPAQAQKTAKDQKKPKRRSAKKAV